MDCKPDWSENTIQRIDKVLTKHYTVYEWGTGYSTIWLAQRCGQVITMEHNAIWYDKIKAIAKEMKIFNIDFNIHSLLDTRYYIHIHSVSEVDFVIIDGRNRVRCFNEAVKLGKPIMLDDSEREHYKPVFDRGLHHIDTLPNALGQKATIFQ